MFAVIFTLGIVVGFLMSIGLIKLKNYSNQKKLEDESNSVFKEINKLVGLESFKFISRFNDTLTFVVKTESKGKVSLLVLLDKNDVLILQKKNVIYTTEHADKKIISSIISGVKMMYEKQIQDCYIILGNIIDKKTIKKLNPSIEFPDAHPKSGSTIYTLDYILDRINEVGIENLTPEEKQFLENYQNNSK